MFMIPGVNSLYLTISPLFEARLIKNIYKVIHVRNFIRNKIIIVQAVRLRPLTAEVGVQSPMTLYEIPCERSGTKACVPLGFFSFSLLIIIPPIVHTQQQPGLKYAPGSILSYPLVFKLGVLPLILFLTGCRVLQQACKFNIIVTYASSLIILLYYYYY